MGGRVISPEGTSLHAMHVSSVMEVVRQKWRGEQVSAIVKHSYWYNSGWVNNSVQKLVRFENSKHAYA